MTSVQVPPRAEIVVELAAIGHNVRRLRELVGSTPVMVVVKADGYGHGMAAVARTARAAGADWLGVATPDEAVALRDAGDTGPLLCWLAAPGQDYRPVLERDVEVTAYSVAQLDEIVASSGAGRARVQLKVDTGLSRGGATRDDWADLCRRAAELQTSGSIEVTGIWSHLACSDEPEHPANAAQEAAFADALQVAAELGLEPRWRHLANSAGALLRPSARFDLVRIGIASYGLNPAPGVLVDEELGLRPAMRVRASLALVKQIEAGAGVSYGHRFVADRPMRVGLVPAGYADGVPRAAGGLVDVSVGGGRCPILGRVCMDQFVIDLSGVEAAPGDEVILFGGEGPTAREWAERLGTIDYEIVTRIGGRMARTIVEDPGGLS